MVSSKSIAGKLLAAGLIVLLLVGVLAMLMLSLQSARRGAMAIKMGPLDKKGYVVTNLAELGRRLPAGKPVPAVARAVVRKFDAEINLTPRVSVGTATPESIYEANFKATIEAVSPAAGKEKCQIALPLPPQIISLAEVDLSVNGDPTEDFALSGNALVWQGVLDHETESTIMVTYSAVGKGVYTLEKPAGRIIREFRTKLIANESDIRMLELSLQPTELENQPGKTVYAWEYKNLVVARPIALDVLGIAAIDRLGELTWLGPLSVLIFGVLVALVTLARDPEQLSGWMLVLIVGCFAGAYPLMYFMQDFISLPVAIVIGAGAVIAVIAWRSISLFGRVVGLFGGILLPGAVMALTIAATIYTRPAMQGVLLTAEGLLTLVVAMILLPRAQANLKAHHEARSAAAATPPSPKARGS